MCFVQGKEPAPIVLGAFIDSLVNAFVKSEISIAPWVYKEDGPEVGYIDVSVSGREHECFAHMHLLPQMAFTIGLKRPITMPLFELPRGEALAFTTKVFKMVRRHIVWTNFGFCLWQCFTHTHNHIIDRAQCSVARMPPPS